MQELSISNTLVLPSLIYENSPTALFDALKLNVDIIASDLGGISEIVRKYYGHLVYPYDIKSLSIAMEKSLRKNRVSEGSILGVIKENIQNIIQEKDKSINKKPVDLSDLQAQVYIKELLEQLHLS